MKWTYSTNFGRDEYVRVLVEELEGQKPFGRTSHRWIGR
jgi:hypothetical protein